MAFNLGLGLEALKGYQARDRQIKAEDYQDRQRDYGTAQMDAYQPGLQDAAAATSAANQLRAAQASAESTLLPKRVEVAGLHLGNQASEAKFKAEQMPGLQQTESNNSAVKLAESEQNVQMLPITLSKQVADGLVSNVDAQKRVFGAFPTVAKLGEGPALQFINNAKKHGIFGELAITSPEAVHIRWDPASAGLVVIDAEGGQHKISQDQMSAWEALGQEFKPMEVKQGNSLIGVSKSGQIKPLFTAPSDPNEANKLLSPATREAQWLKDNKLVDSLEKGYRMAKSLKSMSENAWVADYVKTKSKDMGAGDPMKLADEGRKIYRYINAHGNEDGIDTGASNSGATHTLEPDIESLFKNP